jgi:hypothetical protein
LTGPQSIHGEARIFHANQPQHRMAHFITQTSYLAIPALVELNLQPRLVIDYFENSNPGGSCAPPLDVYAATPALEALLVELAADFDMVQLVCAATRVQELGHEVTVVGHEQNAARRIIEATHGNESRRDVRN